MKGLKQISYVVLIFLSINVLAAVGGDDPQKRKAGVKAQPKTLITESDSIPDSLLHPRWKIQRITPLDVGDLKHHSADLKYPDNVDRQ